MWIYPRSHSATRIIRAACYRKFYFDFPSPLLAYSPLAKPARVPLTQLIPLFTHAYTHLTLFHCYLTLHKSGVSMQRAANTPITSTPCVSLHRPRAPGTRSSQMAFTPAPGNHGPWVQQRKTRSRPRATTSPPPVFDISSRNRFAPLCETDRDAVVIGDSIVRHVRATLAEGKVHTHCLPGARVLDVSVQIPAILKDDESVVAVVIHAGANDTKLRQTETLKRDFRSLIETVRSTSPIILRIGPKNSTQNLLDYNLQLDGCTVTSSTVKNLGVILDSNLCFENHISHVTKTAFFHLRNIAKLRNMLSVSDAEKLVHAFMTSRLDYCNALLGCCPASSINKLQIVQNAAARVLTRSRKYDHITPILQSLHWLPIKFRISYKILLLAYKALNDLAPAYLTNLLSRYNPTRSLRNKTLDSW